MTKTEKTLLIITVMFFLLALLLLPRGGAVRRTEQFFAMPAAPPEPEQDGPLWITLTTRIDLNHATESELTALPGVGKVTAAAIVEYRESHGPFTSVEELLLVPGIGEATLEAILAAGEG